MEVKVPVWTGLRGPGPLKYPLKQGLSETGSKHCIQARPHFTLPHFGPILGPFWGQFGTHLETQNKGITLQNAHFGNKFTHFRA